MSNTLWLLTVHIYVFSLPESMSTSIWVLRLSLVTSILHLWRYPTTWHHNGKKGCSLHRTPFWNPFENSTSSTDITNRSLLWEASRRRTNPINRGPAAKTMMLLYTPDFSLSTPTCHLWHDLVSNDLSRFGVWSVPTDESQPRHHIEVVHLSDNGPLWLSQQGLGWSSGGGQLVESTN